MDERRKLEVAAWLLAAFLVVFFGARLLDHGGGDPAPVAVAAPSAREGPRKQLVVDVDGEVRRPGMQRVPAGSRAGVAVRRAGGLTRRADGAAVNLAAPLEDGQQLVIPRRGASPAPAAAAPAAPGAAPPGAPLAAPISLATATVAQLDTLDGIGPTLAARIVAYRDEHGGFRSIDELKQVDGIGEKRFAALKEGLTP